MPYYWYKYLAIFIFVIACVNSRPTKVAYAHCVGYHPHHCNVEDIVRLPEQVIDEIENCLLHGGCDPTQFEIDPLSEVIGEAGRELYPTAATIMWSRHMFKSKDSLKAWQKWLLRPHFGQLVDQVRIVYNAELMDNVGSVGGQALKIFETEGAQTYGHDIYLDGAESDDFEQLMLLVHELVHAEQYGQYGHSLSNFGYHYFKSYAKNGFKYDRIGMEEEAYAREGQLYTILKTAYHGPLYVDTHDSIGEAIRSTRSGQIIEISPGHYRESITISKPMILTAPSGSVTIGR